MFEDKNDATKRAVKVCALPDVPEQDDAWRWQAPDGSSEAEAADAWSVGLLLQYLFNNGDFQPFEGMEDSRGLERAMTPCQKRPPSCPRDVHRLIVACCSPQASRQGPLAEKLKELIKEHEARLAGDWMEKGREWDLDACNFQLDWQLSEELNWENVSGDIRVGRVTDEDGSTTEEPRSCWQRLCTALRSKLAGIELADVRLTWCPARRNAFKAKLASKIAECTPGKLGVGVKGEYADELEQRRAMRKRLIQTAQPTSWDKTNGPLVLLGWHGYNNCDANGRRDVATLEGILRDGLQPTGNTDMGWYGHGVYLTDKAENALTYCHKGRRSDGKSTMLLCAAVVGNVLPLLPKDGGKYEGRPIETGFDAHWVPVRVDGRIVEDSVAFAHELVLRESDQVLPLAVVTVGE